MNKITYTNHALLRLKIREINKDEVVQAIKSPLQLYLDTITKNLIAISPRSIKKNHYLLIAYTIEDNNIKVTTI